jgi:hypothetical protein
MLRQHHVFQFLARFCDPVVVAIYDEYHATRSRSHVCDDQVTKFAQRGATASVERVKAQELYFCVRDLFDAETCVGFYLEMV